MDKAKNESKKIAVVKKGYKCVVTLKGSRGVTRLKVKGLHKVTGIQITRIEQLMFV